MSLKLCNMAGGVLSPFGCPRVAISHLLLWRPPVVSYDERHRPILVNVVRSILKLKPEAAAVQKYEPAAASRRRSRILPGSFQEDSRVSIAAQSGAFCFFMSPWVGYQAIVAGSTRQAACNRPGSAISAAEKRRWRARLLVQMSTCLPTRVASDLLEGVRMG